MDISFTKTVDLRVFCANFGVERGTVRNFAKVTSVKNAVFAVFQFLVVFAEFTFTLEQVKFKADFTLCSHKKLDSERGNR